MHIYDDPAVCSKTSCIQICYGMWVNLAEIGIGMSVGFSAVAIPQLNGTEGFVATSDELAWIASVLTLSSPLGCLFCGLMIDRIGRRMMQVISQLPMAIGWWYTALSTTPTHLVIGRVITGIGVGMSAGPIRIYTTEISLPNLRGMLGAFNNIAISIGITVTAAMGAILKWTTHCYICGLFSAFLMIINFFLPETPYHVLMRDNTEHFDEARRALKKFRSKNHDIDGELDRLIDYKKENEIRRISFREKIKALFQESACIPFFIIMPYILVGQCSGISIMIFWTIDILKGSNLDLDLYLCNIGLSVTRIISGLITSILMYYFNRRSMALISAVGLSMVCFAIGGYLMTASSPTWYPLLGFMLYMLFASLGYYTLPLLIMFELYPLMLRGFLGGITVSFSNLFIFSSNKMYPIIKDSIGLAYTFITFGLFSLVGTIFLCIFLPETKDLTLQEIEEYYNKKRPTLTSERKVYSAQWLRRSQQTFSSSVINLNKTKSLDHHKASVAHSHTGHKLGTVPEDFNMHRPLHETPSLHSKSSDDDSEAHKKQNKRATINDTDNNDANMNKTEDNENTSSIPSTTDPVTKSSTAGHVSINPVVSQSGNVESAVPLNTVQPARSVESTSSAGPSRSVEPFRTVDSSRSAPSTSIEPTKKDINLFVTKNQDQKSSRLSTESNVSEGSHKKTKQKDRKHDKKNKKKNK